MISFLETYSISDILVFLAFFAIAIKEFITVVDLAKKKVHEMSQEEILSEKEKAILDGYDEAIKQNKNKIGYLEKRMASIDNKEVEKIPEQIAEIEKQISLLIESDREDIKAYLTERHHYFCYKQGWIDDYSLECCEKRFTHYEKEGGNSFIADFMNELRALPKLPPKKEEEGR